MTTFYWLFLRKTKHGSNSVKTFIFLIILKWSMEMLCLMIRRLNFYKSIYLSGMISVIEHNYESDFYGYVNGDILLSHNVYEVLTTIEKNIRMNRLLPDVFIIGKRFNLDHNHNITIGMLFFEGEEGV